MKMAEKSCVEIVLVAPPLSWEGSHRMDIKPPMNLLYLASYLASKDHSVELVDVRCDDLDLESTITTVTELAPNFLGFPLYQGTEEPTLTLLQELKQRAPKIKMILGGPLATAVPERLARIPEVSAVVVGEGELALQSILENPMSEWSTLPGIAFVDDKGDYHCHPDRAVVKDLDGLPHVDYGFVDYAKYVAFQKHLSIPQSVFMTISRGCLYRCTYCATPVLWPGKVRRMSVERVIAEIKYQQERYPGLTMAFMDDSFFADRKWLQDFFKAVAPLKVRYATIGRADHLRPEDVDKLAETGCIYVSMGVETGNSKMQKVIKKRLSLERVAPVVERLAKHKVFAKCFFMLGFPGETPSQMAETINFAVSLRKRGMSDCIFFPVNLYAGTELAERHGAELRKSQIYIPNGHQNRDTVPEKMSENRLWRYSSVPAAHINEYLRPEDLVELVKLAYSAIEDERFIAVDEIEALRSPKIS